MNRDHNFNKPFNLTHAEVNKKVAIHEAGHAAAIYLGNKQKGLPSVFFRIFITPVTDYYQSAFDSSSPDTHYIAHVDRGRLIPRLPASMEEATMGFSLMQKSAYQRAIEVDIINILAGPLAEAKYIALRDGEPINPRLVNLNALQYYGGTSDLENVYEYLECLIADPVLREQKISELFLAAFCFITEQSNWRAITALADYITGHDQTVIEFDEIVDVLETAHHVTTTWFDMRFPVACWQ
ncbi:MAG: hypothetical protein HOP23_00665 [Methylococcaceae bacterium]|nr:hypothetical protein [Methylococcaceae bacterium]